MTQTRQPYYVNADGEVVDPPVYPEQEQELHLTVINPLDPGNSLPTLTNLPLHYQALRLHECTPEEAEAKIDMLNSYTQAETYAFPKYVNNDVLVKGAILWRHGPTTLMNGEHSDGWWKILLKIEEPGKNKETVIVESSSIFVADAMVAVMALKGYGDWEKGKKYHFFMQGKSHKMTPVVEKLK